MPAEPLLSGVPVAAACSAVEAPSLEAQPSISAPTPPTKARRVLVTEVNDLLSALRSAVIGASSTNRTGTVRCRPF
jgi:hypothetical protein